MAGSAIWAVQEATYGLLAADETLQGLLSATTVVPAVFDWVPTNSGYPYIVIGDISEQKNDTLSRTGRVVRVPLLVASRSTNGAKEISSIVSRLAVLLDRQKLTLTGWSCSMVEHVGTVTGRDSDGIGRRAQVDFDVWVHQT